MTIQSTFTCENTVKLWHTHLFDLHKCCNIRQHETTCLWHDSWCTKAADLFFGILIVVSALLLGQEPSNMRQKTQYQLYSAFFVFAVEELTLNWASNKSIHLKTCSFGFSCALSMDSRFSTESVVLCLQEPCTLNFSRFPWNSVFCHITAFDTGLTMNGPYDWLGTLNALPLQVWFFGDICGGTDHARWTLRFST